MTDVQNALSQVRDALALLASALPVLESQAGTQSPTVPTLAEQAERYRKVERYRHDDGSTGHYGNPDPMLSDVWEQYGPGSLGAEVPGYVNPA